MAQPWVVRLKRTGLILLGFLVCYVVVMWGFLAIVFPSSKPPREKKLIENFYVHRAAFERLRDMLLADEDGLAVASWGVETKNSAPHRVEPGGDFPINRYNEYLALLKQTGGNRAFRFKQKDLELIGISVWATGWGADTRHIDIYWTDRQPTNQVASLDDYYQTLKPRHPVFRHIDGNWYLWADW
jgi:hypothetical protein